jgi:hypothetical protein
MNRIILSVLVVIFLTSLAMPQKMRDKILKNKGKLEQLEKAKLIEALDLNEENSIRFFSRRSEYKKELENIDRKSDEIIVELENTFNSDDKNIESKQTQLLNEFLKNKETYETKRSQFINSLNDILTKEQICKFVVFEKKFRDEIRNVILDKKSSGHLKNNRTKD